MKHRASSRPPARPRLECLEARDVPAVMGQAWPVPQAMSISFVPDGTRIGSYVSDLQGVAATAWGPGWQFEVLSAFQAWASQTGINFAIKADNGEPLGSPGFSTNSSKFGDVRVAAYAMPLDVIAYSIPFDASAGTWAGDLILNSAYAGLTPGAPTVDLYSVVLHEAGNLLGIPDSKDPKSPLFDSYIGRHPSLTAQDVGDIQSLYGARQPDRYEGPAGNSSIASATPIVLGPWGPAEAVMADLQRPGDVDVYRVSVPAESDRLHVRIVTGGISLLTAQLTVFDSSGRVVGSAVAIDPRDGMVEFCVEKGASGRDFFVEVRGARGDAFDVGSYALVADTVDTAGSTAEALERLMFRMTGMLYSMASLEAGLPGDAADWASMLRIFFKTPAHGRPASYTAAMGAVLDRFLASLGDAPFDVDALSRLGNEIASVHSDQLLAPGVLTEVMKGLKERGALDDLVRDLWAQSNVRGVVHEAFRSGEMEGVFQELINAGMFADFVREIWADPETRREIIGLVDSGALDVTIGEMTHLGGLHEMVASLMPTGYITPTEPAELRSLARHLLTNYGDAGVDDEVVGAFFGQLFRSPGATREFLELMRRGALDRLGQSLISSKAARYMADALLSAAARTDPSTMSLLVRAFFPRPAVEPAAARELVPFGSTLGGMSNYLYAIATTDARGVTISRVVIPESDGGPAAMMISALELAQHPSRPVVRVFDAEWRLVASQVLDSSDSNYLVQVLRPVPGATYFLEITHAGPAGEAAAGIYFLSASFEDQALEFDRIAAGVNVRPGVAATSTYEAPETQLVHWVFSVRGPDGRTEGALQLKVVDAYGSVFYATTTRAGEDIGLALHLPRGIYSLIVESEGEDSFGLEYELQGHALSDSINPYDGQDPSLIPIGYIAPIPPPTLPQASRPTGTGAGGARAGVVSRPGLGLATLGPISAPHMSSFGAEGPAGSRLVVVAPGPKRPRPMSIARGPADPSTPWLRTFPARPSPPSLPPGIAPPEGAWTREAAGAGRRPGAGRAPAPVVLAPPRPERDPADGAAELAAMSLPHDLAVEALDEQESAIEIRASEIVVAGLLAGGAVRIVNRRRARKAMPLGPVSAFGKRDGRSAAPGRGRAAGAFASKALLIRTSPRAAGGFKLRRWLEADGVVVHEATATAWSAGLSAGPDVILLEHGPGTRDGAELLLWIKETPAADSIPVVLFSTSEFGKLADEAAEGLDLGAADVLPASVTPAEFRARIRRVLRLRREREGLERVAASDGLTGLCNRSAFEGRLAVAWCDCRRIGRPLGLIIADLDHFKRVNDTCGHPTGDEVLRRVAAALNAEVGPTGFAARYGGEEFVGVVPGCDRDAVLRIGEAIRRRVGELAVGDLGLPFRLTISIGAACSDAPHAPIPAELLARADRALYQAKAAGRDAVRM